MKRDLSEFVQVFENSNHVKEDTLAASYVQLTNCSQSLQAAKTRKDDLQSIIDQGRVIYIYIYILQLPLLLLIVREIGLY